MFDLLSALRTRLTTQVFTITCSSPLDRNEIEGREQVGTSVSGYFPWTRIFKKINSQLGELLLKAHSQSSHSFHFSAVMHGIDDCPAVFASESDQPIGDITANNCVKTQRRGTRGSIPSDAHAAPGDCDTPDRP